jgi:hypothetical protein
VVRSADPKKSLKRQQDEKEHESIKCNNSQDIKTNLFSDGPENLVRQPVISRKMIDIVSTDESFSENISPNPPKEVCVDNEIWYYGGTNGYYYQVEGGVWYWCECPISASGACACGGSACGWPNPQPVAQMELIYEISDNGYLEYTSVPYNSSADEIL